jgi:predicted amidohydrolase YtcJ
MALAGITRTAVPDPVEEAGIIRDASGNPTGILLGAAMELAERGASSALTREQQLTIARDGFRFLNSFGITTAVNATGNLNEIKLYAALRDQHQLTVRTRTAFGAVEVPHHLTASFLAELDRARAQYHDEWVSAGLVKFFADGAGERPSVIYKPEQFALLVETLDKQGYQLMTHALRADSVHMILAAYGALDSINGLRDRRLRIEHADVVDDEDLSLFPKAHIIASMQPSFCCEEPSVQITERWRSLRDQGTVLAFSSDWPCTWPPNPFVAMQEAVTRESWHGASYGAGQGSRERTGQINAPQERITIGQALDAYTRDAAYANFMEHDRGSLTVGKLADMVILSDDLFLTAPEAIGKVHVMATVVGGRLVYGALP